MDAILGTMDAGLLSIVEYGKRREGVLVKEKKVLIIILIVFLISVMAIQLFRSDAPVEIGREAPTFKLQDLAGHEVSLNEYRGKIVILDFWATWCGPCRMTMPVLDRLEEEFAGKLVVLAINLQEPKDVVREYALDENLRSRVLLDQDGSIGRQYNTAVIPMQYVVDQNGIIRYIMEGVLPGGMYSTMKAEINKLL